MRSTSFLILLISLWSSVCLAQRNNGARLAISLKQVTDFYNSHNGLFFMQARSAKPIAIPDFVYPEGNVSVHNASIHLMPPRNLDIAAVGQNSFSISLSDLSATISGQATYGLQTYAVHLTLNQTNVTVHFDLGWDAATKTSTVKVTDFSIKVADNSIDFHDPQLNPYGTYITSLIREINPEMKKSYIEYINAYIAQYLDSNKDEPAEITVDDYIISVQLTGPIQNKGGYTYVMFDGRSHLLGKPSSCKKAFRKFNAPASATIQLQGTPDMLECLFYTFVEKLNTLDGNSRPFGPGTSVRLLPGFTFDLRDGGKLNLRGKFELDVNTNGKTANYTIAMDASFDVRYPRHDLSGLDTSVTPRMIKLTPLKPTPAVNDLVKKMQAKFPVGIAQNSTVDTGVPPMIKNIFKYDVQLGSTGILVPIQL